MKTSESSAVKPPFLAFASDAQDADTLKVFAARQQWPEDAIRIGDIKTAVEYLKSHPSPELLLVEIPSVAEAPALLDALAEVCDPGIKVITIGSINEYSFYCSLMDMGISSYLLKPLTAAMLEGAYEKSIAPPTPAKQKPLAKVIAVMGTRGGVGTTTVALNLAGILADLSGKHIGLIDLDPREGSIALALDIEPCRGFRDVLEKPERIDSLFVERVMSKPVKNISVLSAEESLQEYIHIHDQTGDLLLQELRDKCDYIVMDVPRHLTAFSQQCLLKADHVVLVTEVTLLSLRDTLRMGDLIRDTLKLKPAVVVGNRIGLAPKKELKLTDFEKGINVELPICIPFAPDIFMHIGADIPAVKNKNHAAVKPLYTLAEQLFPEMKSKMVAKTKKSFALFTKKDA